MRQRRVMIRIASLLVLGVIGSADVQAQPKEITPAEFRKAVQVFMNAPSSDKGKAAGKSIIVFTIKSKDVVVAVGKEETEWFGAKKDGKDEKASQYLIAYMAGHAMSQLDQKKSSHDMHAGLLQVFKLYDKFRMADKNYKNADLDMLHAKQKTGKLKAYLADVQKKGVK